MSFRTTHSPASSAYLHPLLQGGAAHAGNQIKSPRILSCQYLKFAVCCRSCSLFISQSMYSSHSQCLADYYLTEDGSCKACPDNAVCTGGSTLPRPKEKFWSDRSSPTLAHHVYPCPFNTCVGAMTEERFDACWTWSSWNASYCDDGSSANSSLLCEPGSFGPLCGLCESGYILRSACLHTTSPGTCGRGCPNQLRHLPPS